MIKRALASILVLSVLVGCNSGPSIVGKWTGNMSSQGQEMLATIEYKADKTWEANASIQQVAFRITGTYELKEGKLSQTTKETKIVGDLPAQLAPMKAQMEAAMAQGAGQTTTSDIEFVDADTMKTKTQAGQDVTFKRVKS